MINKNMKSCLDSQNKYVFADSSFFICLFGELKLQSGNEFFNFYNFCISVQVHNEIIKNLDIDEFKLNFLNDSKDFKYYELFKPILSNSSEIKDRKSRIKKEYKVKGEYEVIGLSHLFHEKNRLKYFIIDDKAARNIVKDYFSELSDYLTGTIGFIAKCSIDGYINKKHALNILDNIKYLIENNKNSNNYPCSLGKNYNEIISRVKNSLMDDDNYG